MTTTYEHHEYDVLIIGAGGAGLRAAIEAKQRGLKVGVITKSLLGKAHTVMAEGGIAAAMGNVSSEDNWMVHFRDTMRGGKFLNNYRMAELHAKESPDRVCELEQWGALFDRTADGKILQRDFGGHRYAAPRPRRRPHGPRTDPHPPAEGRLHGHRRVHGVQGPQARARRATVASRAASPTGARPASSSPSRRRPSSSRPAASASPGSSPPTRGRAPATATPWRCGPARKLIDMECIQFHPTGMVWPLSVRGLLVTEGVRGDGGVLRNAEGKRFMFDYVAPMFRAETADTEEEADKWYDDHTRGSPPARAAPARRSRARDQHRGQGRSWHPPRRRLPRHRVAPRPPSSSVAACRRCTTSSWSSPGVDITRESMEIGPTCHYIMGGVQVDADTAGDHRARALRRGRGRRAACTAPTASAATR